MNAHGQWKVTRVRNVVVQTNGGNFNQQGVLGAFRDIRALALKDQPWAMLVDSRAWDMASEESLARLAQCRQWLHAHGCQHNACVMLPGLRRNIHQQHAGMLPAHAQQYFSTLEEACAWLTANGFPFSVADYPHHDYAASLRSGPPVQGHSL